MQDLGVSQNSGTHQNALIGIPSLGSKSPFSMCEGMSSSNQIGSNDMNDFTKSQISFKGLQFYILGVFHCRSESYLAIFNFFKEHPLSYLES